MNEREKKTLQTPGSHTVVINAYMNAREANALKQMIWSHLNVDVEGGKIADSIPGSVLLEQERKTIETMVVSVDGVTDAVLDKLDDLSQDDYQFVVNEVNQASKLNFKPAK